ADAAGLLHSRVLRVPVAGLRLDALEPGLERRLRPALHVDVQRRDDAEAAAVEVVAVPGVEDVAHPLADVRGDRTVLPSARHGVRWDASSLGGATTAPPRRGAGSPERRSGPARGCAAVPPRRGCGTARGGSGG